MCIGAEVRIAHGHASADDGVIEPQGVSKLVRDRRAKIGTRQYSGGRFEGAIQWHGRATPPTRADAPSRVQAELDVDLDALSRGLDRGLAEVLGVGECNHVEPVVGKR